MARAAPARMQHRHELWLVAALTFAGACDDEPREGDASAGGMDGGPAILDASFERDVEAPPEGATNFLVRIENLAGPALPTALGSGAWVLHDGDDPLFTEGSADRGLGLEALAEEGDPSALAATLEDGGTFGATRPGEVTEVIVTARPEAPRLTIASGLAESNDVFLAPSGAGIPLFDESGRPLPARDVTGMLHLWNAGTEIDQAPGLGPDQSPRAEGAGAAEVGPRPFTDSTRALPLARDLVDVRVSEADGTFSIEVENVAVARRLLVTELSPVVWAVHDEAFELFEVGAPASAGIEALAEDANAGPLITSARGASGVLVAETNGARLAADGVVRITAQPDRAHRFLSLAIGLLETNDAFVGMRGVALLDADGAPREPKEIALDVARALAVWDAGTEANEVPGAGPHQGQRQSGPGEGEPDPRAEVRRYDDVTNDLAGEDGGGYATVSIENVSGTTYFVRLTNTSDGTPNPGLISPSAWAIHDGTVEILTIGTPVTRGMESLAEDCHGAAVSEELRATPGVREADPLFIPDETTEPRPLVDGQSYSFEVSADATHRWLALVTMPFPSNDALLSLGTRGIPLLDEGGRPRADADIARDVRELWRAWDAGTEANQSGAAGHDMSPLQESYNIGAAEGDGRVRRQADPVWSYPAPAELVRVIVAPLT